jgi:antitoxin component YwqK of YwqJK toxin-antitoxin module
MTKIPEIIMDNSLTKEVDGVYYHYDYWQRKRGGIPFTGISISKGFREESYAQKYINGKKNGCYVGYYSNGQLRDKSQYKNGKEEGLSEFYDENGNLNGRAVYKNGVVIGPQERFYENGQLKHRKIYSNKNQLTAEEWFDENGDLIYNQKHFYTKEKTTDEEGNLLNGVFEYHYKNGQVKYRINYKDGLRNGLFEHFGENGDVFSKMSFQNFSESLSKQVGKVAAEEKNLATIKDNIFGGSVDSDSRESLLEWVLDYDNAPPSIRNDKDIVFWLIDYFYFDHMYFAEIYAFVGDALKSDKAFMKKFTSSIKTVLIEELNQILSDPDFFLGSIDPDLNKITSILHTLQILISLNDQYFDKSFEKKITTIVIKVFRTRIPDHHEIISTKTGASYLTDFSRTELNPLIIRQGILDYIKIHPFHI